MYPVSEDRYNVCLMQNHMCICCGDLRSVQRSVSEIVYRYKTPSKLRLKVQSLTQNHMSTICIEERKELVARGDYKEFDSFLQEALEKGYEKIEAHNPKNRVRLPKRKRLVPVVEQEEKVEPTLRIAKKKKILLHK